LVSLSLVQNKIAKPPKRDAILQPKVIVFYREIIWYNFRLDDFLSKQVITPVLWG